MATCPSIFVDGNNVMGSRPDGWWRDRAGAARRLVADLAPLASTVGSWTVVFDSSPEEGATHATGALQVQYGKRRGRDAADDRIVELVTALPPGTEALVYTSDRRLRERVTALGARVEGVSTLLRAMAEAAVPRPPR